MNSISFMSANFVARELSYDMRQGWGEGDSATQSWFKPLGTFQERFGELLDEIVGLGFTRIDLWTAHLNWEWATPGHLAAARACLASRGLKISSYAGYFGESAAEFEAVCLLCRELDIPLLGGGTGLLQKDRSALVHLLRKNGLILAIENHPEKSAGELLQKIGPEDEDVLGLAVDTGWFATQGADVLVCLREALPRLRNVHLKDVLPSPGTPTGYPFKDMGHETCCLGDGIVPIREVLALLFTNGYRGDISIEHEPEVGTPAEACQHSRERVEKWLQEIVREVAPADPVGVAIVGCGNIAAAYARQINSYPHVALIGAFDIEQERAEKLVQTHGGKVYPSLEAVLQDPAIEVVVNLSIHHVHAEIIEACLKAGKHVHTEKPLALDSATAWQLVDLATSKGLRLSSAPTTWLGEAQLSAWRRLRNGEIGAPRVIYAEVNWGRIESWHPNPGPFYAVGPVFDVAVYPLTLLTAWFGPVTEVIADGGILYENRHTNDGTPFKVTSPDWAATILRFANGPLVRLTASFYVGPGSTQTGLEIHGDAGAIRLDRWDVFNSPLYLHNAATGNETWRIAPDRHPAEGIEFARGLSDLAHALRENRPHLTTGAHAAHIVEVMEAILESTRLRQTVSVPAPRGVDLPVRFPG
jgi:predicted dehydrogenase